MEHYSPGQVFRAPLSRDEIFSCLEAFVDDVHGGVNRDGTNLFNTKTGKTLTTSEAILMHLYKYERYLRSSGGAFSRASGYNLSLKPMSILPTFQAHTEPLVV